MVSLTSLKLLINKNNCSLKACIIYPKNMVSKMLPCISFKSMQFGVSQHLAKLGSLAGTIQVQGKDFVPYRYKEKKFVKGFRKITMKCCNANSFQLG